MKKTVLYTFTGIVSPILMLVLLPVYLKYLTQTEYIILALTNSFLAVFAIFFNLKTDQAYRTIYFYDIENKEKQTDLFRTIFSFNLISSTFWLLLFYIMGKELFSLIFKNDIEFFPFSFIIISSFLVGNLSNLYFIYLQNTSKAKQYSILVIMVTLLTHVLQLCCVFWLHLSFFWFLCSALLVNLVMFLFIFLKNISLFKFSISKKLLRESLLFSLPFLPFLVLYNLENQLDRFFIERFLSLQELAKYAVLMSIISAVITFFNSIDNAIRPELYLHLGEKKDSYISTIQEQLNFYLFVGLVALSFLIAFGTNIEWFLQNEKYVGVSQYFIPMVLAFLPLIGIRFLALQLVFDKKVSKINWFTVVKLFFMIGLFYVLIPIFGIEGAIITIGISNFINLLLFYFLVELKIVPSQKIILYTFSFIGINFLLIFSENTKFVSLISIGQFFVFGFLFIHYYWSKIKKHIALS
jgi:O-antigen/teichoic acid export membrane protein